MRIVQVNMTKVKKQKIKTQGSMKWSHVQSKEDVQDRKLVIQNIHDKKKAIDSILDGE